VAPEFGGLLFPAISLAVPAQGSPAPPGTDPAARWHRATADRAPQQARSPHVRLLAGLQAVSEGFTSVGLEDVSCCPMEPWVLSGIMTSVPFTMGWPIIPAERSLDDP